MKKLAIVLALASLSLGGCEGFNKWLHTNPNAGGGGGGSGGAGKEAVAEAIKAAEDAQKKAASVGGEWRDVDKMIKEAKASVEKGELDAAMKLAKEAKAQSEVGAAEAIQEKSAKPWLF